MGRDCFCKGPPAQPCRAPKDSKDSFALIPAVRLAGDPEGTQGLSRLQQMASVEMPPEIP
jgi:hypothetical protein